MKRSDKHLQKYLLRYAEPEARALLEADLSLRWKHVLVIPAYGESPEFLKRLPGPADTLLILVLNRPNSEADTRCNDELRQYAMSLPAVRGIDSANGSLFALPDGEHLLLVERADALPHNEGVGLARKMGCDAALALLAKGCIESRWIHCSDADATLPEEYFFAASENSPAIALSYPYRHTRPTDLREKTAIDVYERYLQHYVDGIQSAGSPYAFHTLGSCIAIDATAYAMVRGFPRRAGGEDFYLLNKLAKLGAIATPDCRPVRLSARLSQRAPFGTGPALVKLLEQRYPDQSAIFYPRACFEGLREFIACMEQNGYPGLAVKELSEHLGHAPEVSVAAQDIGITRFLEHANSHCASPEAFRRQFHLWFDGFRTLKFVHALCEPWGRVTIEASEHPGCPSRPNLDGGTLQRRTL